VIHFGKDIRNTTQHPAETASGDDPTVQQVKDWHQDATADTDTSHTIPGRGYLILCEWCEDAFFARTAAEATALFRDHEGRMLGIMEGS
jgi:hypothetical protein